MSANGRTDPQVFTVEQAAPGPLLLTRPPVGSSHRVPSHAEDATAW